MALDPFSGELETRLTRAELENKVIELEVSLNPMKAAIEALEQKIAKLQQSRNDIAED